MQKPYLQKLAEIRGLPVFVVDGEYIRKHIDIEFTNFGQHYRFSFIPERELWLDREYTPGEARYFIERACIEHELMAGGMPYEEAVDVASKKEKRLRRRSGFVPMEKIHKQLLLEYSTPALKVFIVDGELVRNRFYIDFTQGGHEHVYSFVPKGEIWLDDDLFPRERKFVLLHELHERRLMANGLPYPRAHASASAIELRARKNETAFAKKLARELEHNT